MSKVIIRSVGPQFRRAGMAFTREGVVVDTDQLSEAQQQAIANEPALRVERYTEPEAGGEAGDGADAGGQPPRKSAKGAK